MKRNLLLWMLIFFIAGCVSKGKYQIMVDRNKDLKNHIGKLEDKKEDLELDVYSLELETENIKGKLEKTKKEKETIDSTYKNLVKNMEHEIEKGQITITQLKGKLTMNIVDKILFPTGSADIKKDGKKIMARIGEILKDITDKQIRIEGHTDNVPIGPSLQKKFPTNWELSTARATIVTRYLVEEAGVNPTLLAPVGYAEYHPIDSNDTPEGKAHNRRIEIILVPLPDDDLVKPLEEGTEQ